MCFGRRTGSKALEPDPRPFSKKQKRRKLLSALAKEIKIDPKKEKLKARVFNKQAESPQLNEYFEETEKRYLP